MSTYEKEKSRIVSEINKILDSTDSLWILGVILRFTEGMTAKGGGAA